MAVLGGWAVSYERSSPVPSTLSSRGDASRAASLLERLSPTTKPGRFRSSEPAPSIGKPPLSTHPPLCFPLSQFEQSYLPPEIEQWPYPPPPPPARSRNLADEQRGERPLDARLLAPPHEGDCGVPRLQPRLARSCRFRSWISGFEAAGLRRRISGFGDWVKERDRGVPPAGVLSLFFWGPGIGF